MKRLARLAGIALLLAPACSEEVVSMGHDDPVENQGTLPSGPVQVCTGFLCPYGECDNSEFFTSVDCDDVFPGPVDQSSLFCHPGDDGAYCLDVGPDTFTTDTWVVHCGGGAATGERCATGCQTTSSTAECL